MTYTRPVAPSAIGRYLIAALFASPATVAAQPVPKAQAVLDRFEAAIGRVALDKHTSLRIVGTIDAPMAAFSARMETIRQKPNKFVEKLSVQGIGQVIKGFDGTVAWSVDQSGPSIFTDEDVDAMRRTADWYHDFTVPQAMRAARVDSAEFEGIRSWRLTYASTIGFEVSTYFDRTTGLRVGEHRVTLEGDRETIESDYKDFGGVKFATRVISRSKSGEVVTIIQRVDFDTVDPKLFVLPPAIKTLVGK